MKKSRKEQQEHSERMVAAIAMLESSPIAELCEAIAILRGHSLFMCELKITPDCVDAEARFVGNVGDAPREQLAAAMRKALIKAAVSPELG